jgi:uncharacterized protein (TIGR02266 family)
MESSRERREFPRIPHESEVRMEFSNIDELSSEYCSNLSLGGMFIKSSSPLPIGTTFRFELKADESTISGTGKVEWVRDLGSEEPSGMGVRFIDLFGKSMEIIFRIVDRYIQETGGDPFQLE